MQALSSHFEKTLICCPFVPYTSDMVISFYSDLNIEFLPLKNVGGNKLIDKFKIIKNIPLWLKAFRKVNDFADIVYQRFPDNLNIPGFFYFFFKRKKVFATYTGTWKNYKTEPFTYRFQKWLLSYFFRGPVWVYNYKNINSRVLKGFSPSYSIKVWDEEKSLINKRLDYLKNNTEFIPYFITVGTLVYHKNQQYILDAFNNLNNENYKFKLFVVGGGELKNTYTDFVVKNNLQNKIFITGRKTDIELQELYRSCHFLIQAPLVEGFGKVPIEGFFHGVIPILNNVGLAKEMTGNSTRGFLFEIEKPGSLINLLRTISKNKMLLRDMIINGREYSRDLTLENWSSEYIKKINDFFEKNSSI